MRLRLLRTLVSLAFLSLFTLNTSAQALFDVGFKGGTTFYLGDLNAVLFNKVQPVYGAYFRFNINSRWTTKLQGSMGEITQPMKQKFTDISLLQEFNFFEYGLLPTGEFQYTFSPYLCVGVGITGFKTEREMVFSPNIPFGIGVKYKLFNWINIGVEWTMHKLFIDSFDGADNPYQISDASSTMNNDWYSLCTLNLGFDLGERNKFCK